MQQPRSASHGVHLALATSAGLAQPFAQSPMPNGPVIAEGWVLKKRRKRMQGFARRYFVLHQSGLLSYSFEPGEPVRDHIHLSHAAISSAPGRKDIHIDSNNATFHIKCLSSEDFSMWMTAFRKFIALDNATLGRKSSISRTAPRSYNRTGALIEEIGITIGELRGAFQALSEEEARRKAAPHSKHRTDKERIKEHAKDHSGAVLSLFKGKKGSHSNHTSHDTTSEVGRFTDMNSITSLDTPLQRLQLAIESLQHQHSALLKSVSSLNHIDTSLPASRGSPLATTAEETVPGSPSSGYGTIGRASRRLSAMSTHSDGSVWFDAPDFDGAEEYILDATPGEEEQPSQFFDAGSQSSANNTDTLDYSDSESEVESVERLLEEKPSEPVPVENIQVTRRTHLPSPPVGDEGSLFAVLKKNVGKDLSQVALPVSFNEPLTLLQRTAEELEHYDLLTQAARAETSVERMCYIAAFAVSTYASTKYRSGRKGFNPMLAETFEDVRMKFIAEKVCHNPVVLAYHAEGEGWELYATSSGKTKFWGKSLEIIPQGTIHLNIGEEHYEWQRPSSFMRNLMMGTKYLEHCGKMTIHNSQTGARCVLEFKENGYWGPTNLVAGTVLSPTGQSAAQLEGKWDEQMSQKLDSAHLRVLWRTTPFPRNAPEYYGFTSFGITLNDITPDLEGKLPPTDSRFRPDVRALEEGNLDLAEQEKARVEEIQRERRRGGKERTPRWFQKVNGEWIYIGGYWEQREKGWNGIDPLW
ncbi:unnamed protein product [Somion occarium]|uniref:PH domain-containing protein n=1 Tax=Somion occarium TaxID=3059160 RepID=A0ABP1CPG0_9APHY